MEPEKYYLWNTRGGGWFTRGGVTTSDRRDAMLIEYGEAIEMAKLHRRGGGYGLIPVSSQSLKDIES